MKAIFYVFYLLLLVSCASKNSGIDICAALKIENCNNSKRSLNRSAGASLPSVNSAAFNNPAAISLNKGLGIESIHYKGEAQLGIVTGTGRIGAAISNFPNDGTFFGNTAIESVNAYRLRIIDAQRLKENKLVLAGGFNLFGAKKKKGLQADIGIMYRRHHELEENFYGGGVTFTINKIFSFGIATYNDTSYEDLRDQQIDIVDSNGNMTPVTYGNNPLYVTEIPYKVTSYTAGLKFSKFAFDYIKFITDFEDEAEIKAESIIYNVSYFYTKCIFSYGRRFEESFKEVYQEEVFILQEKKSASFLGAQYATKNGFLLGIFHNYYLIEDLSLGLTYFF